MRWILGAIGLVMLVGLGSPPPADALCVCDVFDTCTSAAACDGKSPGDSCTPPRNATCKIVKGNGNGLSCCCGCTRGPGPISCLYTPVADELVALSDAVCATAAASPAPLGQPSCQCADPKLDRQTGKVVTQAGRSLRRADQVCGKGKNNAKHVKSARKKVAGLKKRIQRAQRNGDVTDECATLLNGLVDDFVQDIDDAGQGGGVTTTTTTLPAGPICTPTFHSVPGFPLEFEFRFQCTGGKDTLTGFDLTVAQGFLITNHLAPNGFTCDRNGTLACTGTFGFGQDVTGGKIETTPAPTTPGFGAELRVYTQGGLTVGPWPFAVP